MQTKAEQDEYLRQLEASGELPMNVQPGSVLIDPAPEKVIKTKVSTTGTTCFINLCSSSKVRCAGTVQLLAWIPMHHWVLSLGLDGCMPFYAVLA